MALLVMIETQELKSLLEARHRERLMEWAVRNHPADVAQTIADLPTAYVKTALELMEPELRAEVFGYLDEELQVRLLTLLERKELAELFLQLPQDERVDLYHELPKSKREEFSLLLEQIERDDLLKLATYPESAVGAITTTEYVALRPEMSLRKVLDLIRASALDKETVYILYVVDELRHLLGTLSLRDVLLAEPHQTVAELMRPEPIAIRADQPAESAAELIRKYDLLALPVVDEANRMLGIVTVDEAIDVEKKAELERLTRFGGALGGPDLSLRFSPFRQLFAQRLFWLALLTFFGVLTSTFVAQQEEILAQVLVLAAFIAPIIDMGGNTGGQAATLVIRSMALGEVRLRWRDVAFVIKREIPIAVTLGIAIAVLEAILAFVSKGIGGDVLMVVGLSMLIVTMLGGIIGSLLPFAARRLGFDPATLSSPVITSIMDLLGVMIYFGMAYAFLGDMLK